MVKTIVRRRAEIIGKSGDKETVSKGKEISDLAAGANFFDGRGLDGARRKGA